MPLKEKYQSQSVKPIEQLGDFTMEKDYAKTKNEYAVWGLKPTRDIEIQLKSEEAAAPEGAAIPLSSGIGGREELVLLWEKEEEWFEWSFEVPTEGLYEIHIEYYTLPGTGVPIQRGLTIDGEIPFKEAYNMQLYRSWVDEGEPRKNSRGDDIRPRQAEIPCWKKYAFQDGQGIYSEPLLFHFTKGRHSLRLEYIDQDVAIAGILVKSPDIIPTYAEVRNEYMHKGYRDASQGIEFQAESHVIEKSDPILRRECDEDPLTRPQAKGYEILNVMAGWRWKKGNQSITWEFDVPETGLYKIGIRLIQDWGDGLPAFRKISIDGRVPFQELMAYKIDFDRNWRVETLHDEQGEPFLFYLTEGSHTLTMTVKAGPLADIINSLNDDIRMLSGDIRKIVMITGDSPDIHYDYDLPNSIPGLLNDFRILSDSMQAKIDLLDSICAKRPSMSNNFMIIRKQLEEMINDPFTIARRLQNLNNALTSLSSWYLTLQELPLLLDYFLVSPQGEKWPKGQSNIFQRFLVTLNNLVMSFTKDYDSVASLYNEDLVLEEETITVWLSRGMEWGEILKEIVDEDFTPRTGKYIKMNILPASQLEAGAVNALMLAIVSGKAPDVALGVSANSPVEFAIRNSVVDLTRFENYDEVAQRFIPGGLIPYQYQGGAYALPETMDFRAIYYRTDILDELGLDIPDTWYELYQYTLPVLYQNGLQFYYPPEPAPFLFQHGGSFYNEEGTRSALDSPEAYTAFKEFTELYTNYGIPIVANAFNRFRTGEMPIVVGNYWLYVQLAVAAPELTGRWAIAPIPGMEKEDGTIDRTVGGISSQACMIMQGSDKKEAAWEFIDWWTSDEIQARYGRELEAVIGMEARWNTANVNAFRMLPWKRNDLDVIMGQLEWGRDMPIVLGGYFTTRHLVNAWNRIVLGEAPVRDSLEKAVRDINVELKSRQEEYGIYVSD